MNTTQLCAATVGVALLVLALALGAGNVHGKDLVPSAPPLLGQVIDADTRQPIPNALVIAVARGYAGSWAMSSGQRYLWAFAAQTGTDGRFATPAWTWSKSRPITFDDWGLDFGAYAPGYEGANLQRPVVRVPIERARILGLFPTDDPAPSKPVSILLRRIKAANRDEASAKALWMVLSIYKRDWDADRPGDPLVYQVLKDEVHRLLASQELSRSTRDGVGTREGLSGKFEQLQIDIEGPPAYPAPRKTERAKRANGGSAATPAR